MVSRRRTLHLAGSALLGLAGCLDAGPQSDAPPTERTHTGTSVPTTSHPTTEHEPPATTAPGFDPPRWESSWTLSVPERHVLGLDPADGLLYATTSSEGGPSALVAIDPGSREIVWRTPFDGEATDWSHAGWNDGDDHWGVTLTDDTAYSVNGYADSFSWTALHAVDRATGAVRWSFERSRKLAVHGIRDGIVFVTGVAFFEPENSHDTPEEPLTTVLYALDAGSGTVRWRREFTGVESVAVGDGACFVAVARSLVALEFDGDERWRFESSGAARNVFPADIGAYYVTAGVDDATVHAIDQAGTERWTRSFIAGDFLRDGDRLYVGGTAVRALDSDGSIAWRDDVYGGDFLLDSGREYLFSRTGRGAGAVAAYEASTGKTHWTFDPPYRNVWPVASTDEIAVAQTIGTDVSGLSPAVLLSVDLSDGSVTGSHAITTAFSVESLDGDVFYGDANSSVVALE